MKTLNFNNYKIEYKEFLTFSERNELMKIQSKEYDNDADRIIDFNLKMFDLLITKIKDGEREIDKKDIVNLPADDVDVIIENLSKVIVKKN